jgi:hypothetical protein
MLRYIGFLCVIYFAMHNQAFADGDLFEDLFGPYRDRTDTVTPGAGDAKDTNAAVHVIDPWPPHVWNRHIPANGTRSVEAIRRYHRGGTDASAQGATANPPAVPTPTGPSPGDIGNGASGSGSASGTESSSGSGAAAASP